MKQKEWQKIVLVTGGAGFIGSNFVNYYVKEYPKHLVLNLDLLTYAGNLENLKEVEKSDNYLFIKGNICDSDLITTIFQGTFHANIAGPDTVYHFAAESHVDRSINNSTPFVTTNVLGTQVLLDAAKSAWNNNYQDKRFIHVSTDEVYGSLGEKGLFTEQSIIKPNSPYSASKAGSDLLVRSFFKTFNMPCIITRCSNNYGPFQFPEKLIPLIINNIINSRTLPVYGKGENIRDWLYVLDHCEAIDVVSKNGKIGEVYNIGGNNEWKNIDIVKTICKILDKKLNRKKASADLIEYVKDRPGHDLRYAIDASKIKNECQWKPRFTFETGIEKTIDWYLENNLWLQDVTSGKYLDYYREHYSS